MTETSWRSTSARRSPPRAPASCASRCARQRGWRCLPRRRPRTPRSLAVAPRSLAAAPAAADAAVRRGELRWRRGAPELLHALDGPPRHGRGGQAGADRLRHPSFPHARRSLQPVADPRGRPAPSEADAEHAAAAEQEAEAFLSKQRSHVSFSWDTSYRSYTWIILVYTHQSLA